MLTTLLLAETVALVGGTVHTLAPGAEAVAATLLVEDGRVVAVGADLRVPDDARVVDVTGLHVVPGLIDGFAYHDLEHEDLYTAAGVTLLRDHGNDLARILRARASEVRDALGGPSLSTSGAVLDGYPPTSSAALILKSEHEAHAYVPTMIAEGVDFLSVQVNLPEDAWREVLALAHGGEGPRLQVWGPRPKGIALETLLDAGQDGLLFLDALLPQGAGWETVEREALDAAIERLASSSTRLTPLLAATARLAQRQAPDDPRLELLGPQYASVWLNDLQVRSEGMEAGFVERAEGVLATQRSVLVRLDEAGVVLVPGSGAPHPWLMPGSGLVDELEQWQRAGLPARRVLELATAGAARALELDGRGTLVAGAVADALVLREDPTEDIARLRGVEGVLLRGRWLDRAHLDGRLASLRAALRAAREEAGRPIEVAQPTLPEGEVLLRGYTETNGASGRVAGERWAVVRGKDGALHFCGRRLAPGGPRIPPVEVEVRQTLDGERLGSFRVTLRTAGRELAVRGQVVAGQMRVERRMDGAFVDNRSAREAIAAVDVSSVTTLMLVAHARRPGPLPVIRFDEALELEVVRWDLALEEDGDHWLRTHNGRIFAALREDGALKAAVEQQGSAVMQLTTMELDASSGPGLPLPEATLARMRAARAAEAAAPAGDEGGGRGEGEGDSPPPPTGGGAGGGDG